MQQQLFEGAGLNLEPAKEFFTEAIRLTQAFTKNTKDSDLMTTVPVESGKCVKMTLCDEYDGVRLQKFFAKKGTSMIFSEDNFCRGFIVHKGDMVVIYDEGQMRLPKERHFFYIGSGKSLIFKFIEDTWFYVVSIPS